MSSLFTLPRVLAGPVTGVLADAMGWRDFFVLTVVFGVPGLLMLGRFVPWNARDVEFDVQAPARGRPLSRAGLAWRVAAGRRREPAHGALGPRARRRPLRGAGRARLRGRAGARERLLPVLGR